jgi:ectoine hydroxylase-related dioxygenase (phytanoyl-CoA dioxygenase family)
MLNSVNSVFDDLLTVDGEQLDATHVVERISAYGVCLVRNAVPRERMAPLREAVRACYVRKDELFQRGNLSQEEIDYSYTFGALRPLEEDLRLPDGTTIADFMLDCTVHSPFRAVMKGLLGSEISVLKPATHVRRITPEKPERDVPWHQDCSAMRLHDATILNFWFPLDRAGITASGIEVIPIRLGGVLPYGSDNGLYKKREITESQVRAIFNPCYAWTPVLEMSDVLILEGKTVHRTHTPATAVHPRMNFEVRVCSRKDLPRSLTEKSLEIPFTL